MTRRNTESVTLVELDDVNYRNYRETLVRDYAAEKVRAGVWSPEEADEKSANEVDGLLPEGPATHVQTTNRRSQLKSR